VQSGPDNITKPLPLHEFWPLHELVAVLQVPWPLQEFTPKHWTFSPATAEGAAMNVVLIIRAAAAAAIVAPDFGDIFI
jgi:hypothetical protein